MPSLVPGFEYDIFISYRQNDNARGWVTDFAKNLKEELASTIKDSLSVYFDANPEDGLLETHDVDKSLEGKLKCAVFIPIISQTYCDPKSFAWQHEFRVFNRLAKNDFLGRDLRLANGNVASRILPIKIHELDAEDVILLENEIGGALRSVEFIFNSAGVNRPLNLRDSPDKNFNKTDYHDQVNKVANAVKELIYTIKYPNRKYEDSRIPESEIVEFGPAATNTGTSNLGGRVNSIAVLPFVNLSQDPAQEYFADGIMENILIQLSSLRQLRVISRTSVMRYRRPTKSAPEIAHELGVNHILEGSAQAHGNKVRIHVQLIDAISDQPVWGKVFVESLDDIFTIQTQVAEVVATELKATLLPKENEKLKEIPTKNLKAFDLFMKGRHAFNQWNLEGYRSAKNYFKLALDQDPEFTQAYSYLASTYSALMSWNGDLSPDESLAKINIYLPEAIKRGATDNDYLTQAFVEFFINKNFGEAEQKLLKAMELGPNNASVLYTYSYVLSMMGRLEEALQAIEKAKDLDPTSVSGFNYQFIALYLMKRYHEAKGILLEALQLFPLVIRLEDHLARVCLTMGSFQETVDIIQRGLKTINFRPASMLAYLACAYVGLRQKEKAVKLLDELVLRSGSGEKGVNLYVAHIYCSMGEIPTALTWLANAKETNDIDLIWFNVDPLLSPLRNQQTTKSSEPDYEGAEDFIREKLRTELPTTLQYHSIDHIEDVFQASLKIAEPESLTREEINLIRIAALFHDSGMIIAHHQHEERGCEFARQFLPPFGFNDNQLAIICGMIMATRIPQSPQTLMEKIICDADLDYLGRDDFYKTGAKLYEELRSAGLLQTEREWNLIQKTFLESHRFHTPFSRANREGLKHQHLQEIINKLTK